MPPRTSPVTEPATMEIWFIPRAFPRSFDGNASVIIAALLEKRNAEPMAWTILKRTSSSPDCERLQSAEPRVKIANPSVYSLTLPNMSASLPKFTRTEAVMSW